MERFHELRLDGKLTTFTKKNLSKIVVCRSEDANNMYLGSENRGHFYLVGNPNGHLELDK